MEDRNQAIVNELQTIRELVYMLDNISSRLTPDNTALNAATLRSLNNVIDGLRGETVNLQNLLDTYPQ